MTNITSNLKFVKRKIQEAGKKNFPAFSDINDKHLVTAQKNLPGNVLRSLFEKNAPPGSEKVVYNPAAAQKNAVGGILRSLKGENAPWGVRNE